MSKADLRNPSSGMFTDTPQIIMNFYIILESISEV